MTVACLSSKGNVLAKSEASQFVNQMARQWGPRSRVSVYLGLLGAGFVTSERERCYVNQWLASGSDAETLLTGA